MRKDAPIATEAKGTWLAQRIVAFALLLGLCSWHLDTGHNANTISRAAMVLSIVQDHSLCIDPYEHLTADKAVVNNRYYSEKAPLPALLVVPAWYVLFKLHLVEAAAPGYIPDALLRTGGFLCGSLPLAIIMVLCFHRLRNSLLPVPRMWLATLPFIGSFLYVYSGSFQGHLLAALFLLLAWRTRAKGHALLSGMFASAAVLCEYSLFVFPLVWLGQDLLQRRWTSAAAQVFGGLPGLFLLGTMNMLVTGSPLQLPYMNVAEHVDRSGGFLGLGMPDVHALHGLLFSTYRGLFTHAPVAILCAIVALGWLRRSTVRTALLHPLVLPTAMLVLMIAGHSMWWGGWAYGPRHLTSIAVLLLVAVLPRLPDRPWADASFYYLSAWGLVVALAAKSTTWYSLPTEVHEPFTEVVLPTFLQRAHTESQWPVNAGFSPFMGSALFFVALFLYLRWVRNRSIFD